MYMYKAKVINVVDGDTVDLDIDLGFKVIMHDIRVRLLGINAPESRGKDKTDKGTYCKNIVTSELLGKEVEIKSTKDEDLDKDSFGRWLVTIFLNGENYNQSLLDRGLVSTY